MKGKIIGAEMDRVYERPVVLVNDEVAEGVYTSSGSSSASYSVSSAGSWGNGDSTSTAQFSVTIDSSGSSDDRWTVTLSASGGSPQSISGSWIYSSSGQASVSCNSSQVIISGTGTSASGGFQVVYTGDSLTLS